MRTEVFKADTINEAAEKILEVLKEHRNTARTVSTRSNVIYFDGWDGLGASAVLRTLAGHLTTTSRARLGAPAPAGLEFDQVIHIDCSLWESRRALQRAIAVQLKLPDEVMGLFDKQDEEDDFRGLAQRFRSELQEVVEKMYQHMQNRRFLVIFHNGGSEEIDLASFCGFLLSGYSTSMVLWTFQGRFRMKPRNKVDAAMKSVGATDTFISMAPDSQKEEQVWSSLVLEEAAEVVAACNESHGIMVRPAQVAECFLYMLELCCRGSHSIDYDLVTHGPNYWVCDSIIHHQLQQGEDGDDNSDVLWRIAHALQRGMPLDMDHHQYLPSPHLPRFMKTKPYWTSPTCGFTWILDGLIHNGNMFQQSFGKKLITVLKLSSCTFDFESPPFLCCHGLRFLWLDHCQGMSSASTAGVVKEEDLRWFFQGLWVLVVRYTDCDQILSTQMLDLMTQLQELNVIGAKNFDMGLLQGRLPNIRKLRVTKSSICSSCPGNRILLEMDKMELLEFSGNDTWDRGLPTSSSPSELGVSSRNSYLETVILEECDVIPRMFFRGCTKLKNLLFRGRMRIRNLDISGTAVKTLDFSATSWGLLYYELCLLNCENLCAILWPPWLGFDDAPVKLLIDTTQSMSSAGYMEDGRQGGSIAATQTAVAAPFEHGNRRTTEFGWHISVRDARLLFSLESVYGSSRVAYVEVSSPARPTVPTGFIEDETIQCGNNNEQQVVARLKRQPYPAAYADIKGSHVHLPQQANEGEDGAPMIMSMWSCPDPPSLTEEDTCYMLIQDRNWTKEAIVGEETSRIMVPEFVPVSAKILHVHDSLSITTIPSATMTKYRYPAEWLNIEWCKIERCPGLKTVFSIPDNSVVDGPNYSLRIFWASQLLKARYIVRSYHPSTLFRRIFPNLTLLHLDYCPRLIHAFPVFPPVSFPYELISFKGLEIIEIMWCADLREVFPVGAGFKPIYGTYTADFPTLKHIHLHELPSLYSICGFRMSAPNLETVKIRGCWSLTRLPDVSSSNKVVECDCEKEWWDKLEWDNSSQADHYKPIHPRYYKKTLLKGSVLR